MVQSATRAGGRHDPDGRRRADPQSHPARIFDLGFTGAYGALAAHDMTGRGAVADFDYFEYVELR